MPREALIQKAIHTFGSEVPMAAAPKYERMTSSKIFVHGCTSVECKDIPVEVASSILVRLDALATTCDVRVGSGLAGSIRHQEWAHALQRTSDKAQQWRFAKDEQLIDLEKRIRNSDVVISADTSVAHFAYKHRKPTICIYSSAAWDNRCVGSLFHNSAFGFAYEWEWFFVCVIKVPVIAPDSALAESVAYLATLLLGTRRLSAIARQTVLKLAHALRRAEAENESIRSKVEKIGELQNAIRSAPLGEDQDLRGCLSHWIEIEEISRAIGEDFNSVPARTELLKQFVRLHPLTKFARLIQSGVLSAQ
jgi:hypothetical protein